MDTATYLVSVGRSGSGMTSGASHTAGARRGGIHIWDAAAERTLCGRLKGSGHIVNQNPDLPGHAPDRKLTCAKCRKRFL